MTRSSLSLALAPLALLASAVNAAPDTAPVTPGSILEGAPSSAWTALDPADLLVIDLKGGGRVTILLATRFAPAHVANIKAMAAAGYYDGLWIDRVQENYVVQWGDPTEKKPLPGGIRTPVPAEYDWPAEGLALRPLPYRDSFAAKVGFVDGWPIASDGAQAWLTHCYSMVGVGRGTNPDTGSGAELYAVSGHSPRALDRNIALVGRVIDGIDAMTSLPRGKGQLGFYTSPELMMPIVRVRLASALPERERPKFAMLDTRSATFDAWVKARANRQDTFFIRPAGAIDLCNALPPVKAVEK